MLSLLNAGDPFHLFLPATFISVNYLIQYITYKNFTKNNKNSLYLNQKTSKIL